LVRAAEEQFLAEAARKNTRVAVLDIPLLFETGGDRRCDAVVVVSAPEDIQRIRIFSRPGMTEQKFAGIVANQMPDAEKRRRADFVVDTSKGFDAARAQVREILARIVTMPKRRH
jgi:dephospho-CoA kinase